MPAKNDPSAAIASAEPARPLRAIWCPSRQDTTDEDLPDIDEYRRGRAAILRAIVDAGDHDQARTGASE